MSAPATGPFVADLLAHLERSSTEPVYRTMSHAVVHGGWPDFAPAWHLQRFPLGRVWVWPGYVAFLSSSRLRPGRIPRGAQLAVKLLENYREVAGIEHTIGLARELGDRLRGVDARLGGWLANPNTIVVPTSTIASVVRRREKAPIGQVQWIEVESAGRRILFSPPITSGGKESFGALAAVFGRDWEPRLYDLLAGAPR